MVGCDLTKKVFDLLFQSFVLCICEFEGYGRKVEHQFWSRWSGCEDLSLVVALVEGL
jgi:hypothetical protein